MYSSSPTSSGPGSLTLGVARASAFARGGDNTFISISPKPRLNPGSLLGWARGHCRIYVQGTSSCERHSPLYTLAQEGKTKQLYEVDRGPRLIVGANLRL